MVGVVLTCLFAYLLGAIPTGYWLVKWLKGIDVRTVGSGSTGATNVLRAAGKGPALFVFFFDIFKGYIAVTAGLSLHNAWISTSQSLRWITNQPLPPELMMPAQSPLVQLALLPVLCGLLAVVGHSKSVFLKFSGGKSAATALGSLIGLNLVCAAGTFGLWLTVLALSRYVSLASIFGGFFAPVFMYLGGGYPSFVIYALVAGLYVVVRHKSNFKRLMEGTEPRLGQKRSAAQESRDESGSLQKTLTAALTCAMMVGVCPVEAAPVPAKPQAKPQAKPTASKGAPGTAATVPSAALSPEESANIKVYKSASKAVVNITAISSSEDFIFGSAPVARETGSGSIITPDGYVLTNNHVIGDAKIVKVTLHDGTSYPARLVGTDPDNDLAVLKIDPQGKVLTTIKLGDSSRLEVGRRVYAIGNPFGLDLTMTSGIISSVGRTMRTDTGRLIKGVIQTDAAINPGNSGGPLLDNQGDMIGVTTAIVSRAGQSAGIGFAIPINIVKRIVPQLIQYHAVIRPDTGILAVRPVEFAGGAGLLIAKLDPDGPAAEAGLRGPEIRVTKNAGFTMYQVDNAAADIIVKIDSVRVQSVDDLLSYIETKKPGQVVTLSVISRGKVRDVQVKLAPGTPAL